MTKKINRKKLAVRTINAKAASTIFVKNNNTSQKTKTKVKENAGINKNIEAIISGLLEGIMSCADITGSDIHNAFCSVAPSAKISMRSKRISKRGQHLFTTFLAKHNN